VSQQWRTRHQTIVVVDVAGFTDPARIAPQQRVVHEALYRVLRCAFAESGVDLTACHMEDRGDGAMILLPPEVEPSLLADQLTSRLVAGLRRHNALYSAGAAMQLRVALHAGEVHQDSDGVVSQAVNLAFRILEAPEAKAELRSSAGILALIASESFYREVIAQDPAAEPDSYRQIHVSVKETSTSAWLRLLDRTAAPDTKPLVLELFPATEVQRLREWLAEITIPQLPTLVQRAGGPGVSPAMSVASAWEAFSHLAEFNAGADGFPPALMFVELVAHQVGGDVRTKLTEWSDEQAQRLRLGDELRGRRAAAGAARIPVEPRLHLMIVVQHDGIDPDRYLLSYWRQDDPSKWPPPRGETRMVRFEELERRVDDLVVSAERAWSGHAGAVALEFVLPRALLTLPVHRWHKEHDSGEPRPLCLDYPVVVRSLERMQSSHWHRVWRLRWKTLMNDPSAARVHVCQSADLTNPHRMDALLSEDPQLALVVLTSAPSAQPRPGADELGVALRSGLPALVWHPEVSSAALRAVLARLVEDDGLGDMPGRAQALRRADFHAAEKQSAVSFTHGLVVLWDNPHRVVTFDQPPDIPQPRGEDTSDERERAS
jgi:hypothetical protein